MRDSEFNRRALVSEAEMVMADDEPRYTSTPSRISVPELVRCMRTAEQAGYESYRSDDSSVSHDFALGMWTAFACIRYDFSIYDAAHVDVDEQPNHDR